MLRLRSALIKVVLGAGRRGNVSRGRKSLTIAERATGPLVKAQGVRWDLSPIHRDADEARTALARLLVDAAEFQRRWQGRIASLDAVALAACLQDMGVLINRQHASLSYCQLRSYADSGLAENQDLQAVADRSSVQFANLTRFFELEWKLLDGARARASSAAPELANVRHFLERLTEEARHTLSAAEEQALAERSTAAEAAWQQLFDQTTSAITAEFAAGDEPATPHTIHELLVYQFDDRREVRQRALDTLHAAEEPWTPVLAKVYDSLVGDRLTMDRLRHFVSEDSDRAPLPMQQANRANDLSDATVNTMIDAVEDHYPLAQRYFQLKARQLGLATLLTCDIYAPMGSTRTCDYDEGRQLVLDSVTTFSAEAAEILGRFFTESRIDAEPRPGKQGGAFCESVAQDRSAYVLLNYTDSVQDAQTLAHELGHGLHAALAQRQQSPFTFETGMAMAEVASTFNELLFFDHLMAHERDPEARRALLAARVERSFLTIFSQTMMARYEQLAYAAKSRGESLNPARLSGFWLQECRKYFGDSVTLGDGDGVTWAAIPHFNHTRFYTYSYAFAHLVSLALYARYQHDRTGFVPEYFKLLAAGGSEPPAALLAALGIDIEDPSWVEPPFGLISSWIDLAEATVAPGSATDQT